MAATTDLRSFDGYVETSTPFMPTAAGEPGVQEGIPLLRDVFTEEDSSLDLNDLMYKGEMDAPVLGILGNRNHGKTLFTQIFAHRMGLRTIGGELSKLSADNHRGSGGVAEWNKFCQINGSKVYDLRKFRLNLLDYKIGFTFGQMLESVKNKIELCIKRPLGSVEAEALKYGLQKVQRLFPKTAEIGLLIVCLRSLRMEDVLLSYKESLGDLNDRHANDKNFQALLLEPAEFSKDLFETARAVAGMLSDLMDGRFGEVFGPNSIADAFAERFNIKNYAGLSSDAIALLQSWFWEIKIAAIARGDRNLYHDFEVHDENHKLWKILQYARPMSEFMKTIRDTSTGLLIASHRFRDYQSVGPEDSEQYQLANNMPNDIGAFLLGKHTIEASRDTKNRLGLKEKERKLLTQVPRGVWGLKIGDRDLKFVTVHRQAIEAWMTESNAANDRKAIRRKKVLV